MSLTWSGMLSFMIDAPGVEPLSLAANNFKVKGISHVASADELAEHMREVVGAFKPEDPARTSMLGAEFEENGAVCVIYRQTAPDKANVTFCSSRETLETEFPDVWEAIEMKIDLDKAKARSLKKAGNRH